MQGGPRRVVSRRRSVGGDPAPKAKKMSKLEKLLSYNPCRDKYTTKETCDRSEFCQWNPDTQQCNSLPIDFVVRKAAILRDKVNQRFLDLLQLSAVDCLVFRELHDDRSRACFTVDPEEAQKAPKVRPYRGYNEEATDDDNDEHNEAITGSNKLTTGKCSAIKDDDACRERPDCFVSHSILGSTSCKKKASPLGSIHFKCPKYYDDKVACDRDPMCRWAPKRGANQANPNNYKCYNKYIQQLTVKNPNWAQRSYNEAVEYNDNGDFTFALCDTTSSNAATHWRVYPMKHKKFLCTAKDVAAVLAHLGYRNSSSPDHKHRILPLLDILEELYEVVEQNARVVKTHHKSIRAALDKDEQNHTSEWLSNRRTVNLLMGRIADIYMTVLKADEEAKAAEANSEDLVPAPKRVSSRTSKSSESSDVHIPEPLALKVVQERLLLSLKPESHRHNINLLSKRFKQSHMHYQFYLYYQDTKYLFDSKEKKGASIELKNLHNARQVHKCFDLQNLSVRLCFHIQQQSIYKVEMRVYKRVGSKPPSDVVRTVVVGFDGQRTRL